MHFVNSPAGRALNLLNFWLKEPFYRGSGKKMPLVDFILFMALAQNKQRFQRKSCTDDALPRRSQSAFL